VSVAGEGVFYRNPGTGPRPPLSCSATTRGPTSSGTTSISISYDWGRPSVQHGTHNPIQTPNEKTRQHD